ncbi:gliding motility lipoprotein GldD [Hyunsoonleella flava]|uniref:Gliding motility lipoprotein GldD n=1 Tax=Hyunsoonleella flava TaxID=2527939 RepID=A0A4V2JA26_9FLAO|nr:gliding motility lipoprotein GldD [Hyunsoonleella flava]TBN03318.1 gliding motility lipoprotein GldD [Hyunsoonleella flava]
MKVKFGVLLILLLMMASCGNEDYVPKPKAFLRLDYPKASYKMQRLSKMPVAFEVSSLVNDLKVKPLQSTTESYGANLEYKPLKATLFLTYKAIDGSEKNLNDFLKDAQKLTLEHTKKADEIPVYPYENKARKVYGMLSEVKGDAASPAQFYVTDSVNHFLTGSLYFRVKPNYDSILPAANYLQKDIQRIMETIEWQ